MGVALEARPSLVCVLQLVKLFGEQIFLADHIRERGSILALQAFDECESIFNLLQPRW